MTELNLVQKFLRNPAFGLIPLLLFSLLIGIVNSYIAFAVALALSVLGSLLIKRQSRLIYDISTITFVIGLLFSFFLLRQLDSFRVFVFVEIVFVLSLIVIRLSRRQIVHRLARNDNILVKNYLSESFRVAFQAQYGLSIHLLIVLLYYIFFNIDTPILDVLTVKILAQSIVAVIIILEIMRLDMLNRRLEKEEWLPVVNESGQVSGRVAKSVTKTMKNKFMHPVVRVALVYKGMIYLKKRDPARILDPGKLDYPFEKYMKFNHELDEAVHNSIRRECENDDVPLRFLLKYVFENETTKRLIFLYVSDIEDDQVFENMQLKNGKLWTEAQIEDNLSQNLFSECFELEYEYLKNTVLMVHHLKENATQKI